MRWDKSSKSLLDDFQSWFVRIVHLKKIFQRFSPSWLFECINHHFSSFLIIYHHLSSCIICQHRPLSLSITMYQHFVIILLYLLFCGILFLIICSKAPACPHRLWIRHQGMEKLYEESEGKAGCQASAWKICAPTPMSRKLWLLDCKQGAMSRFCSASKGKIIF